MTREVGNQRQVAKQRMRLPKSLERQAEVVERGCGRRFEPTRGDRRSHGGGILVQLFHAVAAARCRVTRRSKTEKKVKQRVEGRKQNRTKNSQKRRKKKFAIKS